VPAALAAWAGAWLGTMPGLGPPLALGLAVMCGVGVAAAAVALTRGRAGATAVVVALCAVAAVGASAAGVGRLVALQAGPVDDLARAGRQATLVLRLTGDPVPRSEARQPWAGPQVRVTATVLEVQARARAAADATRRTRTPVVVLAPTSWTGLLPGTVLSVSGRLSPPSRAGPVAAVLSVDGEPRVLRASPDAFAWADPPRRALRAAVTGLPADPGGLLPSLVVGDETLLTDSVRDDLRATGLTHLTAVSGANVAVVLAAVLGLARWVGVPLRVLPVVGLLAVGGFVLLARPEPSVVRAAAMGVVAVLGLLRSGGGRGVAPLAVAATVLLLVDPWLSRSAGFALSCLATAGIVLLAAPWADGARWLPRPVALAVTVPLAAQVACTPLLATMTGQLSVAALPANLLAAPAVPAATVLGLVSALVGVVSPALAHVVAITAMLPTGWVVAVAERGASLPGGVLTWQAGGVLACLLAVVLLAVTPVLLASRLLSGLTCVLLLVLLLRPGPLDRWPPPGWVLVACDVGQGDALVLRAGSTRGVVVDTGPDPDRIDACLDDLGVTEVPVLVVTHGHADHAGGVEGVGRGRRVGEMVLTTLDEPADQVQALRAWADRNGVPVRRGRPGDEHQVGLVRWTVLWPQRLLREGSAPNQASLVLRVEASGVSLLLTGDVETAAQRALVARQAAALDVDVLKVPHHGSADQDEAFLAATTPVVAVVSVGRDNGYGHPDAALLDDLAQAGARVVRTDRDGDVAVAVPASDGDTGLVADEPATRPASLTVVARGPRP
jgi:competence protein ComEC